MTQSQPFFNLKPMIDIFLGLFEALFVLGMLLLMAILLGSLLLAWSWGQKSSLVDGGKNMTFSEILTVAGIEWGAFIVLFFSQWSRLPTFQESPRLEKGESPKVSQLPVVLVPSLHLGSGIFRVLMWRLKSHYFQSIWPFSWKSFLHQNTLLEDQLHRFVLECLERTGSNAITIVSFGSSRPLVSRVLNRPDLSDKQIRWICVSGPKESSDVYRFLSTPRLRKAFEQKTYLEPDVLIVGKNDTVCYPSSIFEESALVIPEVGHYGCLLHSTTVQKILDELSSPKVRKQLQELEATLASPK